VPVAISRRALGLDDDGFLDIDEGGRFVGEISDPIPLAQLGIPGLESMRAPA
jgi:hypothetical protein